MSREGPRPGDWTLHHDLINQIWSEFGKAEVDLFATRDKLCFSLSAKDNPPIGVDAFAHRPWPNALLYAFPPVPLIPQVLNRVQEERLYMILIAPQRSAMSAPWFPCLQRLFSGAAEGTPLAARHSLTGRGSNHR